MSLKAGRVGVSPDQVDNFGKIKSEATSGYTKQEADAKFETQTAASEALALKQPILLEVPIEMLSGTKLTVESALQGLNEELTQKFSVKESACTDIVTGATSYRNKLFKQGNIVVLDLTLGAVTVASGGVLCKIPIGYIPREVTEIFNNESGSSFIGCFADPNGNILTRGAYSNAVVRLAGTWVID